MAQEKIKSKEEALEDALKSIEKIYGKGSIMKLGERPTVDVDSIPTGSILLDKSYLSLQPCFKVVYILPSLSA